MMKADYSDDLLFIVGYILHRAQPHELEVLAAALERRQNQRDGAINSTTPFTPDQAAKKMSESIYASIDASIAGIRHTFRDYAADLLQKEAPELSKEQIIGLVDSWIPESNNKQGKDRHASLAKNGFVQGIPADLLYEMVIQFVSYSLGEMPVKTQRSLANAMHNWTESYWRRFPTGIKQEIKAFLNGEITSGEFQNTLHDLLGLA